MTEPIAGAAGDAWRWWRRDRETLLALAGPFLFLPMLAWLLLVPEPLVPATATAQERQALVLDWAAAHFHWLTLRIGVELFAGAAIVSLYLARDHRTVGQLLRRALLVLPGYIVAVMASWGIVAAGALALIVPGLYFYGRVALTGPVLIAEPGIGLFGAIGRSIQLTAGRGWRVSALLLATFFAGFLALQIIDALDQGLRVAGGGGQPFARAFVEILAALTATASVLVRILLQIALYRRLASPRHGV